MVNISFILPCYPRGPVGGFHVVYEYANNLVSRGHKVSILHPRYLKNEQTPKKFNRKILRKLLFIKDLFFNPNFDWQFIDKRVKMIYLNEPTNKNVPNADFVFATSWETAEYVNSYSDIKGEKIYLIQDYEIFSGTEERIDNTWKFPMKKIFISKWLYKKGLKMNLNPKDMIHIPNGIDYEKYSLIKNIEDRKPMIAMLYNKSNRKGAVYGIEALKITKKHHPNIEAVLFGVIPRPKSLPSWIKYIQNPNQNELVEEIYNKSSIFLCSSLYEGWGLPGAEAMSCGCALISTDTGGVKEYATDKENSLLSTPKDVIEIVENINLLLNDDKMRVSLASKGYQNIKKFNWDTSTIKLEEFMGL